MAKNNVMKLFGAALALAALVGCSYESKPNDYHDGLVVDNTNEVPDITNNYNGVVYDDLFKGDKLNTSVFDSIMNKIAETKIPSWYYQASDDNENKPYMTEAEFNEEVEKLVNEKFYDKISGSEYLDANGRFNEEKLVTSLLAENTSFNITKPEGCTGYNKGKVLFTPELRADVLDNNKLGGTSTFDASALLHYDYTEYKKEMLEDDVKQTLLVSRYLETEKYPYLSSAYARKVSYIAVADDESHPGTIGAIMNAYVHDYIDNPSATVDLNDLAKVIKGVSENLSTELSTFISTHELRTKVENINDELKKICEWDTANNTYATDSDGSAKLTGRNFIDSSLYSTYTNSGEYTVDKGIQLKLDDLSKTSYVTEGWFISNGGLTDLPDTFRKRLFNIRTSRDFQDLKDTANGKGDNGYIKNINGHSYLIPTTTQEDASDVLLWDSSSKTYYIIMVEDALNTDALNINDSALDRDVKSADPTLVDGDEATVQAAKDNLAKERRKNAHEVAMMLATKESYKKASTLFFLKDQDIVFHDTSVWEYFEDHYEEAFED